MYNKHKRLVFIGAGGHAKVCFEIAKLMGVWDEYIFLDDNLNNENFIINETLSNYYKYKSNSDFIVSMGSNKYRKKYFSILNNDNCSIVNLIHPNVVLSSSLVIGTGNVFMPGVIINANTEIGNCCILNTNVSIDHDSKVGDFVHLSPGTTLCGGVIIGNKVWIGAGCTVINNINIENDAIIGAGSLILNNVESNILAFGNPAKKVRDL